MKIADTSFKGVSKEISGMKWVTRNFAGWRFTPVRFCSTFLAVDSEKYWKETFCQVEIFSWIYNTRMVWKIEYDFLSLIVTKIKLWAPTILIKWINISKRVMFCNLVICKQNLAIFTECNWRASVGMFIRKVRFTAFLEWLWILFMV